MAGMAGSAWVGVGLSLNLIPLQGREDAVFDGAKSKGLFKCPLLFELTYSFTIIFLLADQSPLSIR